MDIWWSVEEELDIDARASHRDTFDGHIPTGATDGREIGPIVAAWIFERRVLQDGSPEEGYGPVVTILEPASIAGSYETLVERRRGFPVAVHARSLVKITMEAEEVDRRCKLDRVLDVETDYVALGNRYGHDIRVWISSDQVDQAVKFHGRDVLEAWEADCERLQSGYEDAVLHDMGIPVMCTSSWRVGVLVDGAEGAADPLAAASFFIRTGLVVESTTNENGRGMTVCFVPIDRIAVVRDVANALDDMAMPVAPSPR